MTHCNAELNFKYRATLNKIRVTLEIWNTWKINRDTVNNYRKIGHFRSKIFIVISSVNW